MSAPTTVLRRRPADGLLLAAAFAAAVTLRVALAGPAGAASIPAGLSFAVALFALAVLGRAGLHIDWRCVVVGLAGAIALLLPVVVSMPPRHASGYAGWALATAVVATAEEAFLRGALFTALQGWRGDNVAVVGAAVAFALLHVPLYGWHAVPLDLAVGLLLGALRLAAGSWTAPAIAHVTADLAGWWFV